MKNLYIIFDDMAQEPVGLRMYSIMTFRTNEEAARYFADAVNDTTSMLNKHPGDYMLTHVGTMDDLGNITPNQPTPIVNGETILAVQQPALVKDA